MKPKIEILHSSLSLIPIMTLLFFLIELAESLLLPTIGGANDLNIIFIDALIPTVIIAPFLLSLLKSRRRFEKALEESEKRFRTIFENSPDAIFLADPETGIIIGANSKASELTGRPHEEIIGMHQAQLHPPRDDESARRNFEEHARKTKQKDYIRPIENLVLRADGTEVPVEVLAEMVTIKGRQVMQGVFRDITERKKIEKEKERLVNAINRSTEGITLADENDRFIYVNAAYARIFGLSQKELIGDTWRKISPPEIIAPTEKGLSETLHNRDVGVFKGEVPGLHKDGTIIPTDVSATSFWGTDGKYQGHVCIVKDITERKNAEKKLEESLKRVEEEKAKTQSIMAAIGEGISVQDTDFKVLYQNKMHKDIVGDQKGKYCYREYEHRDRVCEGCPVSMTFKDGKIHTEQRSLIKNEKKIFFEITASPLRDSTGNIIACIEIARNITGRKQMEEKLQEEEHFLESIFTSIQDGIGIIDKDMNILKVNKTAKMWYPHVTAFVGRKCFEVYHGRSERCEICPAKRTFETGESAYEVVPKHGIGGKVSGWLEIYSYPMIDTSTGEMKGVIEYVRDISERKRVEEELRESWDFSEKLINSLRDGLSVLNADGARVLVNKALSDMTGCTKDELIKGKAPFPFWPPEHVKEIQESFESMMQGNMDEKEIVFMRKSGERFPVLISASYMRDEHGKITNLINSIRDITERKRIEEELKSSKEFSETVLDSMNHEISIINVSDFSIIDANRAVIERLNMKKDVLIGKKCYEIIHKQNAPCTFPENICPVLETKKTGKYAVVEHIHFNKDDDSRYIEVSTSPIKNKKGEVVQVVHISKDITERKLAEKQIIASLNEKEVLLREIHHRVKNNMQIVSSLLWLQSEHIKDKNDLEIFKDSQNRIMSMSLVHEKLYRSKDLSGIDIKEYITDLTNNLFQSYGVRAGTIEININVGKVSLGIDSSIPCGLIINELVTNSLKYAFPESRKGEIKVSLRNLNANKLELTVGDDGVGIPDNVNFRKTESLGLRLVTILTENQLHGEINLDRSRGTEFKIKFNGGK